MSSLFALWIYLVSALAPSPDPRVVVLSSEPQGALTRRVGEELRGLGFEPVFIPAEPPQTPDPTALARLATAHAAIAALALHDTHANTVSIWLRDRITDKTMIREVHLEGTAQGDAEDLLAVRAVEMLAASLLELQIAERPPGDIPPGPAEVRLSRPAPPSPPFEAPRLNVRAGMGVVSTPGVGSPGAALFAGVGGFFGRRRIVGLDGELGATAVRTRIDADAGDVALGTAWARVGLSVIPLPRARVSPLIGAGGALLVAWARGYASENTDADGRRGASVAFAPGGSLGLVLRAAPRIRIRIAANVSAAVPEIRLAHGGEEIVRWGRPLIDGGVAIEWAR